MPKFTRDDTNLTWGGVTIDPKIEKQKIVLSTGGSYVDRDITFTVNGMEDTSSVAGVLTANDTTVTMTATGSDSTTLSLDTSAPTSGAYYTIAATGTGGAKVTTGGYLPTNTEKTDSTTLNKYIKRATTSKTNGTASATANAGTASIKTQPSASASITKTGIDAGISSSATSYYVTATANSNSGVVTATGGSASASVTASSTTVGAGYNPSAVTTSTTASSTGTKTGNTATTTAATASKSETVYLKESSIGVATSKPSGYIENTTAVVPTSGYLKLDAGYMPATVIKLSTLVPDEATITNDTMGAKAIRTGITVYDKDGNLVTGTMNDVTPTFSGAMSSPTITNTINTTSPNLYTVADNEGSTSVGVTLDISSVVSATSPKTEVTYSTIEEGYLEKKTDTEAITLAAKSNSKTTNADTIDIIGVDLPTTVYEAVNAVTPANSFLVNVKGYINNILKDHRIYVGGVNTDSNGTSANIYPKVFFGTQDGDNDALVIDHIDVNTNKTVSTNISVNSTLESIRLSTVSDTTQRSIVTDGKWVTNTISPTNTNGATYYGKTIVNDVVTSAFTIAPNKNTATVTVGTLSNGYYPLTNSMTASTNCTTAGWIAAGTKTGNSTSIRVGQIAAAGALTVTPAASDSTVTVGTLSNGYYPLTNTISASAAHASVGYVASTGSTSGSKSIKVGQIAAGTLGISSFNYSGSVQSQTFGSYDTTHSTIPLTLNISHNIQGTPSATAAGYIPKGNGTAVSATKSSTFSVTLDAWDGSYTIATVE